jgi:60 kDa SS-A/Ro ribonucleoprotein
MSYLSNDLGIAPRRLGRTPANQPMPGTSQTMNNAGGYTWEVDDWAKLDRFLILGSEGGTYYVDARKLAQMHSDAVDRLIALGESEALAVFDRVMEVSMRGLAPKNDPALFVLAKLSLAPYEHVRAVTLDRLPAVARTATHLFDFLTFRQGLGGGWGRGLRRAVSRWYLSKKPDALALQLVKYRQRGGWTHRDVLRKAHPSPLDVALFSATERHDPVVEALLSYAARGVARAGLDGDGMILHYPHPLVQGYEMATRSPGPTVTAGLVREFGLPREAVPSDHLTSPEVWFELIPGMPIHALLRNLATMTRVGALAPMSLNLALVINRIKDVKALKAARVHPIQLLIASRTYAQGRGERGKHTWTPVPRIIDALEGAFAASLKLVEPTGKRILVGLDLSGSMQGTTVTGVPNLNCREASAALALATMESEPLHMILGFDTELYDPNLSARDGIGGIARKLSLIGGGGTDCSLPIRYATERKMPVDAFVIYTDSENWQGRMHPVDAIRAYRRLTGIPAKLIVVAMASTGNSIADPEDAGMLNVVGLDASVPKLISEFISW